MKPSLLAASAVVVLAAAGAGAYAYAVHEGHASLDAAVARIRGGLPPGDTLDYATSVIHPFSRSAELVGVRLRERDGDVGTADRLSLSADGSGRIRWLHAEGLRLSVVTEGSSVTAETLEAADVAPSSASPSGFDPAQAVFASAELRGITFHNDACGLRLADLTVTNYGIGRASTLTASGLGIQGQSDEPGFDRAAFGHLSVRGLDLAWALEAAERHVDMPKPQTAVSFDLDGFSASLHGVEALRVAAMAASGGPTATGETGRLSLSGVRYVPQDEQGRQALQRLGLRSLNGGFSVGSTWRAADGRLDVSPVSFDVTGWGRAQLAVSLLNVPTDPLQSASKNWQESAATLASMDLVGVRLSLNDDGALAKGFGYWSSQTGIPSATLRQRMGAALTENPAVAPFIPTPEMRAAVVGFLSKGGQLEVAATPPAPVSFLQLAAMASTNPVGLVGALGVSATRKDVPAAL